MADRITETKILGIGIQNNAEEFDPNTGDLVNSTAKVQYIKLPYPKDGLTEQQIKSAVQVGITSRIYIDDRGVEFSTDSSIVTAYTEYQTVTAVDIGVD